MEDAETSAKIEYQKAVDSALKISRNKSNFLEEEIKILENNYGIMYKHQEKGYFSVEIFDKIQNILMGKADLHITTDEGFSNKKSGNNLTDKDKKELGKSFRTVQDRI